LAGKKLRVPWIEPRAAKLSEDCQPAKLPPNPARIHAVPSILVPPLNSFVYRSQAAGFVPLTVALWLFDPFEMLEVSANLRLLFQEVADLFGISVFRNCYVIPSSIFALSSPFI
jgi:hypothetical protein